MCSPPGHMVDFTGHLTFEGTFIVGRHENSMVNKRCGLLIMAYLANGQLCLQNLAALSSSSLLASFSHMCTLSSCMAYTDCLIYSHQVL